MRALRFSVLRLLLFGALLSSHAASAQFSQQGPKLVGTGAKPPSEQGDSVALSADGNTAIVGGWYDKGGDGAAWVFTRSGGVWTQQGAKLVGSGTEGDANQGKSVALSADGNTAIVGGPLDRDVHAAPGGGVTGGSFGAAWVFTRSGGVWTQQGAKLVGTGAAGDFAFQGESVAVSADGNTAIVGGPGDNGAVGAAWVFTRNGGAWTQQGSKLVGAGAVGNACQGHSVSLSADGNTAIVGGQCDNRDNGFVGAVWIFTRNGGVWTQQGAKLVGTGAGPPVQGYSAEQGQSVSLSADGNTAIVGGWYDSGGVGAAWVFTRSGGVWTQQGAKLVGTGATAGGAAQGWSVALSGDGNTAIVGGDGDNGVAGAAWVFTRSGGVWTQLGSKLVGTGATGAAAQGSSVALSADGTTAIVGGTSDVPSVDQYGTPTGTGAAWVYTRAVMPSVATPDLNQHGLTGSWYEPATSGQGVEVEVFPDLTAPGTGLAFVSWFTYDTVAGGAERQRWYTLSGPVVSGEANAALTIYQNTGGNFNAPPITAGHPVGTATLNFASCSSGQLSYTFTDGSARTGSIPLTRLTQNVTCSPTTARPTNADFAFSGNWFDAATSGQGFSVEVNASSNVLFFAWYTYVPAAGGGSAGAAGQRWYTGQSTFAAGSRSIPMLIYETTGGVFDTPTVGAQNSRVVGSGTMAFQSCSSATLSYNFTGGSSSGMSGTITLIRVGPVPPGCTLS